MKYVRLTDYLLSRYSVVFFSPLHCTYLLSPQLSFQFSDIHMPQVIGHYVQVTLAYLSTLTLSHNLISPTLTLPSISTAPPPFLWRIYLLSLYLIVSFLPPLLCPPSLLLLLLFSLSQLYCPARSSLITTHLSSWTMKAPLMHQKRTPWPCRLRLVRTAFLSSFLLFCPSILFPVLLCLRIYSFSHLFAFYFSFPPFFSFSLSLFFCCLDQEAEERQEAIDAEKAQAEQNRLSEVREEEKKGTQHDVNFTMIRLRAIFRL